MILREYTCKDCGLWLEEWNDEIRRECPECKSKRFAQKLSKAVKFTRSFMRGLS